MDIIYIFLAMVILLLLKGFFSGSEIALVNSDKIHMHHKANQGDAGAKLILKMFKEPDVILGTTLVGTNIATVILTALGTLLMIRFFGIKGDIYAFIIYTPIFLILGEVVPKSVYQQKADLLAPIIIYPLRLFSLIFAPVIFVFSRAARLAARMFGSGKSDQSVFITRELVRSVVEMAERGSNVDAFDRGRIKKVIRFAETTVGEAMIPVAEITAVDHNQNTRAAVNLIRRFGYNRLPVYKDNTSNIFGIITLTTWDMMDRELFARPLSEFIKKPHYVSVNQTIDQLLPLLRKRKDHMAIVVDEFGSAIGMITMEDILEEVVGEIDVGLDFEEYLPRPKQKFKKLSEDVYLIDSRFPISEANEVFGTGLLAVESHTIGGLVMARLHHIPKKGEFIEEAGYRFTVEKATERSVISLRVERIGT